MMAATLLLIFPLCLAAAAFTDLFEMKIPNMIPLVLLLGFFALAIVLGLPFSAIGMHLVAGLIVFLACFTFFAFNVMGGGDAKLLTAASVWFGFNITLLVFLLQVAVLGGILTLLILLIRSQSSHILALRLPVPRSLLMEKKIPYGIAIAIGGFCSLLQSPLVIQALEARK
jgi:prepilin peptidase CpaA